ncbi:PQQ-dependent sugar dehydrogenase [Chitinophaga ginsengisoli]|uniref:Putative secreted protein (Por secretion system target) n=1 Tax=Chitinophaga ginsengisoli TaxID=363837 RepID=A0A2P8GH75_9BACT|nr:PQQ-dependent sugar dehydrogenase [Chitinophaga ginsengisoli]PSL33323.1 putative secreted protein (Por secretion system target) [Chitinophaga ginsengisoli]
MRTFPQKTMMVKKHAIANVLLSLFLLLLSPLSRAQSLPANFQRVQVVSGISSPTALAFLPDGRILVCQETGQLRVIKNGSLLSTPAISLSVNASGERGLIGIAVDPNFATNHYIYLYYTNTSGPHNRVSRFTMTGDVAGAETALLDLPTLNAIYHNGGGLSFGNDGKLYISVGDNKVGDNAKNLDSYMGKLLRINTDGSVPSGNPFSGGAARSRVWAYGLRNPFTNAIDPVSGKIFIDDVGESTWEEINDASVSGRNFGWPDQEGTCSSNCSGLTNPIYRYSTNRDGTPPDGQGCAINGGTFFNGAISNYPATYNGKYFFLDYCGGWINYLNPASPSRTAFATGLGGGLVYIKQGIDGNLYFLSRDNSALYKLIYTGTQAPAITTQPEALTVPQGQKATFNVIATGNPAPTYQWRKNGTNITNATAASYSITNVQPADSGLYSVVVTNSAGSVTSSNAKLTVAKPNVLPVATITAPVNNAKFRAGDTVSFAGTGTDAEDGTLPANAFNWWVDFHHANHIHPGPELRDSVKAGTFVISAEGHTETDIWYRIYLAVKDSRGEADTTYVELFPVTSNITLKTEPAGLQLRLNDIPFTTPYSSPTLSGMVRTMDAPSPQTLNGITYVFDHWAHGGARVQNIRITDNDTTFTAVFKAAPATINLSPVQDAYVRDGSNATTTFGVTDSTLLITKVAPAGQSNNGRESYLTFDLTNIAGLSSVVLKVFGNVEGSTAISVPVGVYPVSNTTWSEKTITWNNKPAADTTLLSSAILTNGTARYYTWDVTSYAQRELAAGRRKITLALKSQQAHDPRILLNAKEAGANTPQLAVIADSTGDPNCVPVVASSDDGNVAANAIDNDLNTRWSASGNGQWIQFCLGNAATVTGVDIAFYKGDTRRALFDVLVSLDGTNWSNAATGLQSSGTSLSFESFSFTARTAKYVRVLGHGNNVNDWNSYAEVKIKTTTSFAASKTASLSALTVYPNPAGATFTVKFNLSSNGYTTLAIYDMSGKQLLVPVNGRLTAGTYTKTVSAAALPAGMYLVKLVHNGQVSSMKIIRE